MRLQRTRLAAVLTLLILLSACKDQTLATVASDLNKSTKAMHEIQGTIIAANKTVPPLIDNGTAVKLMTLCLKVDQATQQSINLTRSLNALGASDRADLSKILTPILTAVNDAVKDPAVSGIKDGNTRATIQLALGTLQTTITSVQTLIAAGK